MVSKDEKRFIEYNAFRKSIGLKKISRSQFFHKSDLKPQGVRTLSREGRFDQAPRGKGEVEERKYSKVGGKRTSLSKRGTNAPIKKKGEKTLTVLNPTRLHWEVNKTEAKRTWKERKMDEVTNAMFRDNKPSKVAWGGHKPSKEVGWNLKSGQKDGEKGRRIAHRSKG
jgi:hypothetical protein